MIVTSVGPYRILQRLGEGGMGVVYKGIHTILEQPVAIKALSPTLSTDPGMKERFLREAKIQAQLTHPNIVNLLNFIEEGGVFYLIMEFIEGETLETKIRRGRISPDQAIAITLQVLDALAFAHSKGVIHRDVKPSNIMVTAFGQVKVTDFGIAKIVGEKRQTATGIRPGTLWYMSPEQVKGEALDPRSDLYSLGVTLYEMVTGQVPFDADSEYAIMRAHVELAPPPPRSICPDIPKVLEGIILKALAKRPSERFQSAEEMARALREVEREPVPVELGEPQRKGTILLPPQPQELRRGSPRLFAIFGGMGVILFTLIAMMVWERGGIQTPPPPNQTVRVSKPSRVEPPKEGVSPSQPVPGGPTTGPSLPEPVTPPPPPPISPLEQARTLWQAGKCSEADAALREAQRQPDEAKPYRVAIDLLLQHGPCSRSTLLGTNDPVVHLKKVLQLTEDLSSLPYLVEVRTEFGIMPPIRLEKIRRLEPGNPGLVELDNGDRLQGTIRIRKG